ncbi:MAG: NAD(P)/FAD-dependent oxidoreductase [Chthoniobacterales bacterium]
MNTASTSKSDWPKVVIVGGGFGGLSAAKTLANEQVNVTLLDRTNHHLFQPLLYQVATAGLNPGDIAQPIRHILRDAGNITVVLAEVRSINLASKRLVTTRDQTFPYDYLIVAAGARHSYFGNEQWEGYAPGLKTLEDALELRRRILTAFETAEMAETEEVRQSAQTFVVVGAGPTGVEMAGAITELAHRAMAADFRNIDPKKTKVILLDAAPRILPTFAEDLSASALEQLRHMGVDVRTNKMVKNVTPEGVTTDTEFIPARTVVWAAGNAASPLAKGLGAEIDRAGRVLIKPDLSVAEHPEVYAIGDMASFKHQTGEPLPGVSPVAIQMGRHAAKNILAQVNRRPTKPFKYFDKGSMATIGRNRGVVDLNFARFGGFFAWLCWLFVHLIFLIGLRNKVLVFLQWVSAYFTYSRGARLIYGVFRPKVPPPGV